MIPGHTSTIPYLSYHHFASRLAAHVTETCEAKVCESVASLWQLETENILKVHQWESD